MSVIFCTPDYYATLLTLLEEYQHELGLSELTVKHLFGGNITQGICKNQREAKL